MLTKKLTNVTKNVSNPPLLGECFRNFVEQIDFNKFVTFCFFSSPNRINLVTGLSKFLFDVSYL